MSTTTTIADLTAAEFGTAAAIPGRSHAALMATGQEAAVHLARKYWLTDYERGALKYYRKQLAAHRKFWA